MKYWKDGFYLEQDENNTRKEITDERWAELLDGQATGKVIYTDKDGFPQLKDYVPTKKELYEQQIMELKYNLEKTDYQAIKFAEGVLTIEEYAGMKQQRQDWRDAIGVLEEKLKNL